MATVSPARATLDALYGVEGKAELIGGRIVRFVASGHLPSQVAFEIAVSLRGYARQTGLGIAYADGIGFAVRELASGRESFSPDASYYTGSLPANGMRFVEGAPALAVEVRSENDYGPAAVREQAAKRVDYFEAGTLVVWDVDTEAELIHAYRATDPASLTTFARGQMAEAEPAVPGWRVGVAEIFG